MLHICAPRHLPRGLQQCTSIWLLCLIACPDDLWCAAELLNTQSSANMTCFSPSLHLDYSFQACIIGILKEENLNFPTPLLLFILLKFNWQSSLIPHYVWLFMVIYRFKDIPVCVERRWNFWLRHMLLSLRPNMIKICDENTQKKQVNFRCDPIQFIQNGIEKSFI